MTTEKKIITDFVKNQKKTTTILGDITFEQEIGESNSSILYKISLYDKPYAIKIMVDANSSQKDRFKAEFLNLASLNLSSNIAKTFYYGELTIENKSFNYSLMELCDSDLKKQKRSHIFTSKDYVDFQTFILTAVKELHDHNIIHRDIKPANILCKNGLYKLADFGIAHYEDSPIMDLTKKGERLANYEFSPREQYIDHVPAAKTMDIFSIGQILLWFITGHTCQGFPNFTIPEDYPNYTKRLIQKCIQDNPKNRFQSVNEILSFIKEEKPRDVWNEIRQFHGVLSKNFCTEKDGVFAVDLSNFDLQNFILDLNNAKIRLHYVFWGKENSNWDYQSPGDYTTSHIAYENGNIVIASHVLRISELIIHKHHSAYKSFILIRTKAHKAFKSYAVVDGTHIISSTEHDNGYAKIDGVIEDLSQHTVEERVMENREEIWILSPDGTPATYYKDNFKCSQAIVQACTTSHFSTNDIEDVINDSWDMDDKVSIEL